MSNNIGSGTRPADFFRLILPEEGWKCIALKGDPWTHHWFQSFEEMEKFALAHAGKTDVYHACASFTEKRRLQKNVQWLRAFWLDVDCGGGKRYSSLHAGREAVADFCQRLSLPDPSYVSSGGGLHTYWPLSEPVDPATWKRYATGLAELAKREGLGADHVCTTDEARILRPPGTRNHKYDGGRLVEVVEISAQQSLEQFGTLFKPAGESARSSSSSQLSESLGSAPIGVIDQLRGLVVDASVHSDIPKWGRICAQECPQLGAIAASGGAVSEPLWYAALGVIAHCRDGEELVHEWSKGDPRYTWDETDRKWQQAKAKWPGPATCETFARANAAGCLICPYRGDVRSPISLGASTVAPVVMPADDMAEMPKQAPTGFEYRNNTLKRWVGKENERELADVYGFPIYVKSQRQGERSGGIYLHIRYWLPHQRWRDAEINWSGADTKTTVGQLKALGINVHNDRIVHFMKFLDQSYDELTMKEKMSTQFEQQGWKGEELTEGFLIGNELWLGGKDIGIITGMKKSRAPDVADMFPRGNDRAWYGAMSRLFVAKSEAQALAIFASLAAPLMRLRAESGGTIYSMFSRESGKGKSTALWGAASIWSGKPAPLMITNNDTPNSRWDRIAYLRHLPVVFDELLSVLAPEVARDFIQTFTTGSDKLRLNRNGDPRPRPAPWSTILITTSNQSLLQATSISGETPAAARVVEVETDMAPVDYVKGNREIEEVLKNNGGWAGRALMRFVLAVIQEKGKEAWQSRIDKLEDQIIRRHFKGDTKHRFRSSFFALCQLAGRIAAQLGILDITLESVDRIIEYGCTHVQDVATINAKIPEEALLAYFISDHPHSIFVANTEVPIRAAKEVTWQREPTYQGRFLIRHDLDTGRLLIHEHSFKDWCIKNGHVAGTIYNALKKGGILERTATMNIGLHTPWENSMAPVRVWVLNYNRLNETIPFIDRGIDKTRAWR